MLIQFVVENYLSFREATTFSMRATGDTRHPRHVAKAGSADSKVINILRAAAIYGANAAGKSNLVLALAFAQHLITKGTHGDGSIPVKPFRLDPAYAQQPCRFEFIFEHDNVLYSYGFAVTSKRVHEEWLFATPEKHERRLFERSTDESGESFIEVGPTLRRSVGSARLKFIASGTRANQLFLTECFDRNVEALRPVVAWFQSVLSIVRAESHWEPLPIAIRVDESFKQFASKFLAAAGTGICRVEVTEVPFDFDKYLTGLPLEAQEAILREYDALEDQEGLAIVGDQGRRWMIARSQENQPCLLQISTLHETATGEIAFRMEEESEGTQRLFHLIPALFMVKQDPKVFVIDELDRRLHTLLTRLFIEQALDCPGDKPQGQLIFTTHDTNLLDLALLRRDEIYLVEKDLYGATHLASLAEWKIRPDLEVEKGYLTGRFGAIPFFGDVKQLMCHPAEHDKVASMA